MMANAGKCALIKMGILMTFCYANVWSEEVCFSESETLYYCDNGFSCCDGENKCCAELDTWAIFGIAVGGVVFVALVITVMCIIVKKTNKPKVRVIQSRPAIQDSRTNYMPHPVGGMMIPGQVLTAPPMYDPMSAGSSGYGYAPAYDMDAEFERYGAMKQKDKFNKNGKKGGSLGSDMTPAPRPLMIGRPMNRPAGGPMSMMEPPPYRSPTPSLSPSPEPPEVSSFAPPEILEEDQHM